MQKPLILAALPLVLAAYQAANLIQPPSAVTPPLAGARGLPANEACGEATVHALDKSGGTQRIAHIPDRRTLYGEFGYGSFAEKRRVKSFTWSSSDRRSDRPRSTGLYSRLVRKLVARVPFLMRRLNVRAGAVERAHRFALLVYKYDVLSLRLCALCETVHRVVPDRASNEDKERPTQHRNCVAV